MKVVTEILQDLEILKRLLKHNANLKIRINYYLTKGLGMHVQRMLKLSRFYTLAEILSKIFVKNRRKIGDLIYDHGLTKNF